MADNLTFINPEHNEVLVVNASLNEIHNWQLSTIPYTCIFVENLACQNTICGWIGILLASLNHLPSCAIGVKTQLSETDKPFLQTTDLTKLRHLIWRNLAFRFSYKS